MSQLTNTSTVAPNTNFGAVVTQDIFAPKDPITFSVMGRVAPASTKVPPAAILTDGSINFGTTQRPDNIKIDSQGRVIETISTSGERTSFRYNKQGELNHVKLSNAAELQKSQGVWFEAKGSRSCWAEIVVLADGTLWCKKAEGIIVQKHLDGTETLQNIRQKFILWFDNQKRLVAIRYPNGQSRSFTYNNGEFCMMTDPDGSRFFLQDGQWQCDRALDITISELRVFNEGTVMHRVGNRVIATNAAGKVTRTLLSDGDPGFQRTGPPPPHSDLAKELSRTLPDPMYVQALEQRYGIQKLLLNCPIQSNDTQTADVGGYKKCSSKTVDEKTIDILVCDVEKDLPLGQRLDLAAAQISNYLFGTFPVAVLRTMQRNGAFANTVVKEVSTGSMQWFERKIWSLMCLLKEPNSEAQLQQIINRDHEFRRKLEEAALERLIIGGSRPEPYFAIESSGSSYKVINIDLEGTFDPDTNEPMWETVSSQQYQDLFNSLSDMGLLNESSTRIASFLKSFNSNEGRQLLLDFGLYEDEIESLLARMAWFNTYQKLPRC